jgi:DNA-binding Lrp family transcriptional regulator
MKSKSSIIDARLEDLEERERRILSIIRKNLGIESGSLSDTIKSEGLDIPDSTLRRLIQKLDKGGYIFREACKTDGGGQTMKHFVDE